MGGAGGHKQKRDRIRYLLKREERVCSRLFLNVYPSDMCEIIIINYKNRTKRHRFGCGRVRFKKKKKKFN